MADASAYVFSVQYLAAMAIHGNPAMQYFADYVYAAARPGAVDPAMLTLTYE